MGYKDLSGGSKKVHSYIGHAGVGSRVEWVEEGRYLILRETVRSQLFLICMIGLVTLLPLWLLIYQQDKIKGGLLGKVALATATVVCGPYFLKSLFRLLRGRRIEIDKAQQKIQFIPSKKEVEKSVMFSDIESLNIEKSIYRSKGQTENFTLVITDKSQQAHPICTSDREADIVAILNKFRIVVGQ